MIQICDVMSKNFKFIKPSTTVQYAAQMMRDLDFGFLPIGENDKLTGTVTDRDIAVRCCAEGKNPTATLVRDVMTPKIYYCFEDQNVEQICDNMADIKVRRLPVVNRKKRLVGIVSLGDVSQACLHAKSGDALQEITAHGQLSKAA